MSKELETRLPADNNLDLEAESNNVKTELIPPETQEQKELKKANEINSEDLKQIKNWVEEVNKDAEMWEKVVKPHTDRVFNFAQELCTNEGLLNKEKNKVLAAVQAHDSIKAQAEIPLLDHGDKSADFIEEKLIAAGKSNDLAKIIGNAIRRHMVYPFLVDLAVKLGHKPFSEPKTTVDKIVYDADVLDNISLKNVAFRLDAEKGRKFIEEDLTEANEKNISQLEAAVENVLKSVKIAVDSLKTESGKKKGREMLIKLTQAIEKIKPDFTEIQVGENGRVNASETLKILNQRLESEMKNKTIK